MLALEFFQKQCLNDSDYIEDEYLFEIARLPRTISEANSIAKKYADEAARMNNYEYDEDDSDESAEAIPQQF